MSVEQNGFRDVFNLEHHLSSEGGFTIGPYRITVSKELIEADFARSQRLVFGGAFKSSGFKNTVTEEPASSGSWSVTAAVAEHEGLDQASVLLPDNPWVDGAHDLSVILSLLTGRHVRVGNDVEPYLPVSAGLALVTKMLGTHIQPNRTITLVAHQPHDLLKALNGSQPDVTLALQA